MVFSDAVHKLLDKELILFSKQDQVDIKKNILIQVIARREISLNKLDIFEGIIALEKEDEKNYKLLEKWLKVNVVDVESLKLEEILYEYIYPKTVKEIEKRPRNMAIVAMSILAAVASLIFIIQIVLPKTNYGEGNLGTEEFKTQYVEVVNTNMKIEQDVEVGILFDDLRKRDIEKEELDIIIDPEVIIVDEVILKKTEPVEVDEILDEEENIEVETISKDLIPTSIYEDDHLSLKYKKVSMDSLGDFLEKKDSILGEEPYLTAILDSAEAYGLNPLLLFAIAGQEQSFVKKSNPKAETIANNPFNVFGSWVQYNTDIHDSSAIVSRTIINLSKNRPLNTDPIKWINRKYAKDQNWWKGVSKFLKELEENVVSE